MDSASASQHIYGRLRPRFRLPEFFVWLPQFNKRFVKSFIRKRRFYLFKLQATLSSPSARRVTLHFLRRWKDFSVARKDFCPEKNRLSGQLSEILIVFRCNGGDL